MRTNFGAVCGARRMLLRNHWVQVATSTMFAHRSKLLLNSKELSPLLQRSQRTELSIRSHEASRSFLLELQY